MKDHPPYPNPMTLRWLEGVHWDSAGGGGYYTDDEYSYGEGYVHWRLVVVVLLKRKDSAGE